MRRRRAEHGFLLMELLIALAILAIPLMAITGTIGQAIDTTAALRDRSVALWVAQDRLALHQVLRDWPDTRTFAGTRDLYGRTWRWQETVATTPVDRLRRIEVEVHEGDRPQVLARVVGFLRDPRQRP